MTRVNNYKRTLCYRKYNTSCEGYFSFEGTVEFYDENFTSYLETFFNNINNGLSSNYLGRSSDLYSGSNVRPQECLVIIYQSIWYIKSEICPNNFH